jgi:3-oxoadipate enol-lactonase
MPAVRVRGADLHYEVRGKGDPVVLCHGFLDNCSVWKDQAEAIAGKHTVVLYDHRGHGRSDKPRGDYSVRSLAQDLHGLILGLHLDRAAVVGHSLGGMIALTLALEHPDLVSKLVLVCTTARLVPQLPITGRVMAGMGYLIPYGVFAEKVMKLRVADESDEAVGAGSDRVTRTPKHVAYGCGKGLLTGYDVRRSLSRVKAPTLILAGERDRGAPVAMSRFLHREIKGSRLHIMPGCGHLPMIEKPREFISLLLDFLG